MAQKGKDRKATALLPSARHISNFFRHRDLCFPPPRNPRWPIGGGHIEPSYPSEDPACPISQSATTDTLGSGISLAFSEQRGGGRRSSPSAPFLSIDTQPRRSVFSPSAPGYRARPRPLADGRACPSQRPPIIVCWRDPPGIRRGEQTRIPRGVSYVTCV